MPAYIGRTRSIINFTFSTRMLAILTVGLILLAPLSSGFGAITRSLVSRAAELWPHAGSAAHAKLITKSRPACTQASLKNDHFLYAAIYSLKDGRTSTLVLNNTTHHDESVQVTLFNKDGQGHIIPEIVLHANLSKRFNIGD